MNAVANGVMRRITRILVANRGEIARRVFRSAKAMGCTTVAVYADGDREAPFVYEADLAVPLGGTTATETYLDASKVLAAATASGADAIHPGYGFLSENADFAAAVIDAGLVWIGPSPEAIAQMGDKLAAKETMTAAGVPTLASLKVEGSDSPSPEQLAAAGLEAGSGSAASVYPLMVKASAGGGGKGMRIVERPEDLADAIAGAKREAAGAFGDDTVFVERCLQRPRHVEVQVLGDQHGNLVHLFERECSIQRRHQKVIEEAPSPVVTPGLRERLGQAALAAVGTLGYWSAGTVEFLLTGEGDSAEFFFLEVNTRLQVEHPVTEAITGIDLVREQIRIAAGEPLGYGQEDLSISGWAVEARLYAEDPQTGFLPSIGTLDVWKPSSAARFDSGVEQGSVIGTEFDPMLAKVITHAPTRTEASLALALALDKTRIGGVVTNRNFLVAALRSEEFLAGRTDTDFIERTGLVGGSDAADAPTDGSASGEIAAEYLAASAAAVALVSAARNRHYATALDFMPTGFRNSDMPDQVLPLAYGERDLSVSYKHHRDQNWSFRVASGEGSSTEGDGTNAGNSFEARIVNLNIAPRNTQPEGGAFSDEEVSSRSHASLIDAGRERYDIDAWLEAEMGGVRGSWRISAVGNSWYVDGPAGHGTTTSSVTLTQRSRFPQTDTGAVEGGLTAPMPGKIITVDVAEGDQVSAGQILLVMEAMKMEHQIAAAADGVVTEIRASVGDQVDNGELLVVVGAAE